MERVYRASNAVYFYAALLALDALVLGREGAIRVREALPIAVVLLLLAALCLLGGIVLLWRWGRLRVTISRDELLVRGVVPRRRLYWADVDRVREFRGPPYQLHVRDLFTGPYLPH